MKVKVILIGLMILILSGCSSDNSNSDNNSSSNYESAISVDDVTFTPTTVKVSPATADFPAEGALMFTLEKGNINTVTYEAIVFKINYPLISSSAPNGVYDFGIGVIGETLFAQGSYLKGTKFYGLAGYTVKVNALGSNKYKLEFQNIQAVNTIDETIVIISGYYEGIFAAM